MGDVMEARFERPADVDGELTAVWSADLEQQEPNTARVMQASWHDAFGLPDETTVIPRVTTKATATVREGEQYGDTAHHDHIELYPATAVQTFTAYRITPGVPVCDASTEYLPESAPLLIDGRADVPGPTFTATRDLGIGVNWIERTYADDTKQTLLSQGVCGQDGEQTRFVDQPDVTLASTGFDGATVASLAGASMVLGAGPIAWRRRPGWARRKSKRNTNSI